MNFVKIITVSLAVMASTFFLSSCQNDVEQKLNIIFILADDQRNDVLSCAGHPIVTTPTIDNLAKNGIRFKSAFVTTSICAASRASIFTGLYECKTAITHIISIVSRINDDCIFM